MCIMHWIFMHDMIQFLFYLSRISLQIHKRVKNIEVEVQVHKKYNQRRIDKA